MVQRIWVAHATVATAYVAALSPSIAVNLQHASHGGGWTMCAVAILSVLALPITLEAMPRIVADKRYDLIVGALALVAVCLAFSLTNALGNISSARVENSDRRQSKIATVDATNNRLSSVADEISELRRVASGLTPEMAGADVMALEADRLFTRSNQCQTVTKDVTSDHCGKVAKARAVKAAAERIKQLEAERGQLQTKLEGMGDVPTTADPKVENITALAGAVMPGVTSSRVGIALDIIPAVLIELAAGILPPIVSLLMGGWARRQTPVPSLPFESKPATESASKRQRRVKPAAKTPSTVDGIPASIKSFAETRIVRKKGESVAGADLYQAYRAHCAESGFEAESGKRFGIDLPHLGFAKDRGRKVMYLEIALRPQKPKLQAVA
jgi:hypothetical protein